MKVFIFDDHSMMRQGLKACFSDKSLYTIAGEAENIENAKQIVSDYIPDGEDAVAIVDVGFSSPSDSNDVIRGFELVQFINQSKKNINCVMYSSYTGQAYIRSAIGPEVGALGYVSKTSESKILIDAVYSVAKGIPFIDPYLSNLLVTTTNVYDLLSKREREVLKLVQKNYSNSQIAAELNITERTVENHLSTIYSKTNVDNKAELINMFGKL